MENKKFGITEGLMIAGIPVVGYWIAFLYEFSYCSYFNIPMVFIDIEIVNILVAILSICILLTITIVIIEPLSKVFKRLPFYFKIPFLQATCFFSGTGIVFFVLNLPSHLYIYYAIAISVVVLFFNFILPLMTQRKLKGYKTKLENERYKTIDENSILSNLADRLDIKILGLIFFISIFSFLALFAGSISARLKTNFIILKDNPERLVLKRYKDFYLTTTFDRKLNALLGEYKLIPIDKDLYQFNIERFESLKLVTDRPYGSKP